MINEATQDAEESATIEKTAEETTEPTTQPLAANAPAADVQPAEQIEDAALSEAVAEPAFVAEDASEGPSQQETNPVPELSASDATQPEEGPSQSQPAEISEPARTSAVEPQAIQEQPSESAPVEQHAVDAQPDQTAPVEQQASDSQPSPASTTEQQVSPAEPEAASSQPAPTHTTTIRSIPAPKQPAPKLQVEPEESPVSTEIDFGAILEQFEQEQTIYHAGELVEGKVVGVTDRGVLVDFGYKSEGFVPLEEFTSPDGQLTVSVGEPVEVVIRNIHSGDSAPLLSRIDALSRKVWDELEKAYQSGVPVTGKIVDKTKGGLHVDVNGIEAFLPGSQIDSRPIRTLDSYIGQDIEARVIKFSRRRNNVVLSRKVITDELVNAQKAETLSRIDVGYVVEGTIKNLTEYGAFVDIGGIDGLLHVTDMSWGRIHHPADQFKVAEHIQVKILKLDREKEKVSLGYKQLLPDPWSTVVEMYPVDSKLIGKVSSVTDYGVFVELEPGVEGLVHVSEISWARRAQSPKRTFHKGQDVEVQVLGVDTVEKRISLGMKQFQENPWDRVDERYPIGSRVHGRVRNLTDFGAFVELEEGIDGLVHVSDISWAKKIKHPKDVLKKDQEVEAIVTSIDKRGQRLSLSMKDLTPSAWEGFVATHRPGDVVKGKVSRFTNFGVFVELGEGLEGLCHISELSDERVERAEDVAQLGQEMDFKILRIEPAEQKIGLSHRAVGKEDEPVVDTKIYSTEAKGGMASLGELANLKFGNAPEAPAKEEAPREGKKARRAARAAEAEQRASTEPKTGETTETEVLELQGQDAPREAEPEAKASPAPGAGTEPEATTPEGALADEQAEAIAAPPVAEEVAPESGEATAAAEVKEEKAAADEIPKPSEDKPAEGSTAGEPDAATEATATEAPSESPTAKEDASGSEATDEPPTAKKEATASEATAEPATAETEATASETTAEPATAETEATASEATVEPSVPGTDASAPKTTTEPAVAESDASEPEAATEPVTAETDSGKASAAETATSESPGQESADEAAQENASAGPAKEAAESKAEESEKKGA